MIAKVKPSILSGEIVCPPSKSVLHRYLISAFLSKQETVIHNISSSFDIMATINCLSALGANIRIIDNSIVVSKGNKITDALDCNECGSTLRFLIPIALTLGRKIKFTGSKKLFSRPIEYYKELSKKNNFLFDKNNSSITVQGNLKSGIYEIPGNVSSQYISGMIFALSTLNGDSKIVVTKPFESKSYVNITIDVLKEFGVNVEFDDNIINIKGGQDYYNKEVFCCSDNSNGAYLDAINTIGSKVNLKEYGKSLQGDFVYKDLFSKLKDYQKIDISDCPDLGPVLFVVSALNCGAEFVGTKRLKLKESDRAEAMRKELLKFGIMIEIFENSVIVNKCEIIKPKEVVSSHNDHRIVMAMMILLLKYGGEIEGIEAVRKSYPEYFDEIKRIGAKINIVDKE